MSLDRISAHACFGGTQGIYRHRSTSTGTDMEVAVYVPPQAADGPLPVLTYLSGLTCTWENFTVKAGAQRYAAEHGVIIVAPDTSPRGLNIPGENDSYDFGTGAGFYVDATQEPWKTNYRMYSYVRDELPALIASEFKIDPQRQGIFGHSMGGHGALVMAFRNPDRYRSVSAFSPIVAASRVPWGEKALGGYLGQDKEAWKQYDASLLAEKGGWKSPILVDQGTSDQFLEKELKPELLEEACQKSGTPLTLRRQPGYDHSYYFIATFMGDHIAHHAKILKA
jgi:S-formylglutathione hydrolase